MEFEEAKLSDLNVEDSSKEDNREEREAESEENDGFMDILGNGQLTKKVRLIN